MQLFVHDPDTTSPQIIEIAETVLVRELVVGHDGDLVWLAEVEVPLELDVTVVEAGRGHGHHVHRGPHRKVEVNLVGEGRHAHHRFAPSLRCARIIAWGVEHLQLGKIADVELIDRGSGAVVDPDRQIGTLTRRGHGTLELELRRVRHDVHIVVNATRHTVAAGSISFDAVVALAYPNPPGPNPEYTVQYRKGPSADPKRSLLAGHDVEVREGMIFNVTATDKS